MNYREKMRKAIECPQFGNIDYGEWGTLRLDQRKNIKRLLDEMDRADEVIKHQFFEIERLKKKLQQKENIINELEKWAKSIELTVYRSDGMPTYQYQAVLDKLKELKEGDKE